jgi:hypothetical protein
MAIENPFVRGFREQQKKKSAGFFEKTVVTYDPSHLTSLSSLFQISGTIFGVTQIWTNLFFLFMTMICVALVVYRYVTDPHRISTKTITVIVHTLSTLIGFGLGMFLKKSLNRWWMTVTAIQELFDVIMKINLMGSSFMMTDDQQLKLARLGALSVHLLEIELSRCSEHEWGDQMDKLEKKGMLMADEKALLLQVPSDERSYFVWTLIIKAVKPLRKNMDSFSYDRYVELIQEGTTCVTQLQSSLNFQFPYVYMHMLTFMVNVANNLSAIGQGLTIGVLFARERETHNGIFVFPDVNRIQNEVLLLLVQSLFYQSFLSIGASLSYPLAAGFHGTGKRAYSIPLGQMCAMLEHNLALINNVGDNFAETPQSSPAASPSQPSSLPQSEGDRARTPEA